jgi:hypothetical protein
VAPSLLSLQTTSSFTNRKDTILLDIANRVVIKERLKKRNEKKINETNTAEIATGNGQ